MDFQPLIGELPDKDVRRGEGVADFDMWFDVAEDDASTTEKRRPRLVLCKAETDTVVRSEEQTKG